MRKVYHTEPSAVGMVASLACSVGLTLALFGSLPFAHRIVQKETVEITQLGNSKVEEEPEELADLDQPPEPEKPPEQLDAPDLTDSQSESIPLNPTLDVASGSGAGGLFGLGDGLGVSIAAAVEDNNLFSVEDLEKRPEPVSQSSPIYPPAMLRAKIEGSVSLLFVLNEDGRVEDARVEDSSRPEFEKPALDAIRKWRFRPGMKDGQPVRTYIRAPIRFKLPSG